MPWYALTGAPGSGRSAILRWSGTARRGRQAADTVITMGCGDACPVYPGKRYLDWELPDPAGLNLDEVRPIREQICGLVSELLRDLV
jgi:protein-tyrosine-phosphatase